MDNFEMGCIERHVYESSHSQSPGVCDMRAPEDQYNGYGQSGIREANGSTWTTTTSNGEGNVTS